ncbi:hypothetical protein [Arthrobacter sp. MDT1-65]
MDFNPDTWGTVADWVGGLGTTAAFFAAVLVIARDAKVRRIGQARKVVYTSEKLNLIQLTLKGHESGPVENQSYILTNLSDEPIYDVFLMVGGYNGEIAGSKEVLLPSQSYSVALQSSKKAPTALFKDNSQVAWIRTVSGKVHSYNPRRFRDKPESFD